MPLSYFFYKNKSPSAFQINLIKKWFWRIGLSSRYDEGLNSKIHEDVINVFDMLLDNTEPKLEYKIFLETEDVLNQKFFLGSAFCKTILCYLASKRPKNLKNNLEIDLNSSFSSFNSKEIHHIFPKNYLKEKGFERKSELISNICFLPSSLNKEINDNPPKRYIKILEENPNLRDALKSHAINIEFFGEDLDDYESFILNRSKIIERELKKLAEIEEVNYVEESDLFKEIKSLELLLRKIVKKRLDTFDRKWFNNSNYLLPQQLEKILSNLKRDQIKNPKIKYEDLWDYLDMGIIIDILERHEDKFKEIFQEKFIDYNLGISLIKIINKIRAKETHEKEISAVKKSDIELVQLQLPILKGCLEDFLL